MGFAGGAAPVVAHGSNRTRVFNADGTFSEGSESFTSATSSAGDTTTGVYGTNNKRGGGRWRLDGTMITLESNGVRTVTPAFILPNWNHEGQPELLIGGDWWQRSAKK